MTRKLSIAIFVVVAGLAPAHAATISLNADQTSYVLGETPSI